MPLDGGAFRALPASLDPRLSSSSVGSVDHGRVSLGSPVSPPLASSSKARMALENLRNSLAPVHDAASTLPSRPSYSASSRDTHSLNRLDAQLEIEGFEVGRLSHHVLELKQSLEQAEQLISEQKYQLAETEVQNASLVEKIDSLTSVVHQVKRDTYEVEKANRDLTKNNHELIEANSLISSELMKLTEETNEIESKHASEMCTMGTSLEHVQMLKQGEVKLLQTELIKYENANQSLTMTVQGLTDCFTDNKRLQVSLQEALETCSRYDVTCAEEAARSSLSSHLLQSALLKTRAAHINTTTLSQIHAMKALQRHNAHRTLGKYFTRLLCNVAAKRSIESHSIERTHLLESTHWNTMISNLHDDMTRANDAAAINESTATHAQKELDSALTRLSIAEQQCRDLESNLALTASSQVSASASLRAAECRSKQLETHVTALSEDISTAEAKIADLEQALTVSRLEESRLRNTSASVASELQSSENGVKALAERAKRGEERAQIAEGKLTAAVFELEELRSNTTTLEAQCACAKKESGAASERAKKAEERANTSEGNLVSTKIRLEKAESQLSEEKAVSNAAKVRLDASVRDCDGMRRENEVLRRQVAEGQHKTQRLDDQLQAAQKDLSEARDKLDSEEDKLVSLRRQHEETSRTSDRYQHQLEDASQDIEELRERLQTAEDEAIQLRRTNMTLPTREQMSLVEGEHKEAALRCREFEDSSRMMERELHEAKASLRRAAAERDALDSRLQNERERLEKQHERIEAELTAAMQCLQQDVSQLRLDLEKSETSERAARNELQRARSELSSEQKGRQAEVEHLKELVNEEAGARAEKDATLATLQANLSKLQANTVSTEEVSARMLEIEIARKEEVTSQLRHQYTLEQQLTEELGEKLRDKERWIANHTAMEHKLCEVLNSNSSESIHQGCEAISFHILVQQVEKTCDELLTANAERKNLTESVKSLTQKLKEQKQLRQDAATEAAHHQEHLLEFNNFKQILLSTLGTEESNFGAVAATVKELKSTAEQVPAYRETIELLESSNQLLNSKTAECTAALSRREQELSVYAEHSSNLEAIAKQHCGISGGTFADVVASVGEELKRMSVWHDSGNTPQPSPTNEGSHLAHAQRQIKQFTAKIDELNTKISNLEAELDRLQNVCLQEAEVENKMLLKEMNTLKERLEQARVAEAQRDIYTQHAERMHSLTVNQLGKRKSRQPSTLKLCLDLYNFDEAGKDGSNESSPTMLDVRAPTPLSRKVSLDCDLALHCIEITSIPEEPEREVDLETLKMRLKLVEEETNVHLQEVVSGEEEIILRMNTMQSRMSVVEIDAAAAATQYADAKKRLARSEAEVEELKKQICDLQENETERSVEIDFLQTEQSDGRQLQIELEQHAAKMASLEMEVDELKLALEQEKSEKDTLERQVEDAHQKDIEVEKLKTTLGREQVVNEGLKTQIQEVRGINVKATAASDALRAECQKLRGQITDVTQNEYTWLYTVAELANLVPNGDEASREAIANLREQVTLYMNSAREKESESEIKQAAPLPPFSAEDSFDDSLPPHVLSLLLRNWRVEAVKMEKHTEAVSMGVVSPDSYTPVAEDERLISNSLASELEALKAKLCEIYEWYGSVKNNSTAANNKTCSALGEEVASPHGGALPPVRSGTPLHYQYRSRSVTPCFAAEDEGNQMGMAVDGKQEPCWGRMVCLETGWWVADTRGIADDVKQRVEEGLREVAESTTAPHIWKEDNTADGVAGTESGEMLAGACNTMLTHATTEPIYSVLLSILEPGVEATLLHLTSILSALPSRESLPLLSDADVLLLFLASLSCHELDAVLDKTPGTHSTSVKQLIESTPRQLLQDPASASSYGCAVTSVLHNILSLDNDVPSMVYREMLVTEDIAEDHSAQLEGSYYGWAAPTIVKDSRDHFPSSSRDRKKLTPLVFLITGLEKGARLPHRPGEILLPPFSYFMVESVRENEEKVTMVTMRWEGIGSETGVRNDGLYLLHDLEMGAAMAHKGGVIQLPVEKIKKKLGLGKIEADLVCERERSNKLREALDEAVGSCENKEALCEKLQKYEKEIARLKEDLQDETTFSRNLEASLAAIQRQKTSIKARSPATSKLATPSPKKPVPTTPEDKRTYSSSSSSEKTAKRWK